MVKFYESSFTHPYPFPTVTLAYFLRYPNPYSTHVISTDVLDRHFDPQTNTLHTARLHLKRSKIPAAVLKLLPKSLLGPSAASNGTSQSYILERSVVDMKKGVMLTESLNLEFTGVLAVSERQLYRRPGAKLSEFVSRYRKDAAVSAPLNRLLYPPLHGHDFVTETSETSTAPEENDGENTDVSTKVELKSRLGQVRERIRDAAQQNQESRFGFLRSWGAGSIQKSIEAIGLRRAERAVPKSEQGMNVVLERLWSGGIKRVLEGMRNDQEAVQSAGGEG
ncbi:MAG: hypothetical protein M1831_003978 [Alyxoria varia]|nr:MAG: hypothetical protein M1831_003978 [Alyxoria varia]